MRRRIAVLTSAAVLAAGADAPAITNGQPDDGRHPYVGALVSHDGKDRRHRLACSGSLVSETVFLTAAHCLRGEPSTLYVSFDDFVGAPSVGPQVHLHPGTAIVHPQFTDETLPGDTHDVAVIKLDPPLTGHPVAQLPLEGALAQTTGYELVGYGQEGRTDGQAVGGGGRRFAFGQFLVREAFQLRLDQSGTIGGTCNGDSGGPVLAPGTSTVLALTSDGDADCAAYGIYYRLDTASARDFLDDHVQLPQDAQPATNPVPGTVTRSRAVVTGRFSVSRRSGARVRRLSVRGLAPGAAVQLRCRPPKSARRACPFTTRTFGPGSTAFDLRNAFKGRRLRRGVRLEVRAGDQVVRFRVTSTRVRRH